MSPDDINYSNIVQLLRHLCQHGITITDLNTMTDEEISASNIVEVVRNIVRNGITARSGGMSDEQISGASMVELVRDIAINGLDGAGGGGGTVIPPENLQVVVENLDFTATWDEVTDAIGYQVRIDGGSWQSSPDNEFSGSFDAEGPHDIEVRTLLPSDPSLDTVNSSEPDAPTLIATPPATFYRDWFNGYVISSSLTDLDQWIAMVGSFIVLDDGGGARSVRSNVNGATSFCAYNATESVSADHYSEVTLNHDGVNAGSMAQGCAVRLSGPVATSCYFLFMDGDAGGTIFLGVRKSDNSEVYATSVLAGFAPSTGDVLRLEVTGQGAAIRLNAYLTQVGHPAQVLYSDFNPVTTWSTTLNGGVYGLCGFSNGTGVSVSMWVGGDLPAGRIYVTQAGAGSANGSKLEHAISAAAYNARSSPGAGDLIYFVGLISSQLHPANGGDEGNRLTLNGASALLGYDSGPRMFFNTGQVHTLVEGFVFGAVSHTCVGGGDLSHEFEDIILSKCLYLGPTNGTGALAGGGKFNFSLIVENYCDNATIIFQGRSDSCDIRDNWCRTSENTASQTDIMQIADSTRLRITGNYLEMRAPADFDSGRHNDILQVYESGSSVHTKPTRHIIAFNRFVISATSGDGSLSFMMMEEMTGVNACKIYGNEFIFREGATFCGNGVTFSLSDPSALVKFFNNTIINMEGIGGEPGAPTRFLSPGHLDIRNNLFVAQSVPSGNLVDWTFTINLSDFNFFFNYKAPSLTYTGPNGNPNVDPLFTDFDNEDFSLQLLSPARGAGQVISGSEYAFGLAAGATFPGPALTARGLLWDIGAHQS